MNDKSTLTINELQIYSVLHEFWLELSALCQFDELYLWWIFCLQSMALRHWIMNCLVNFLPKFWSSLYFEHFFLSVSNRYTRWVLTRSTLSHCEQLLLKNIKELSNCILLMVVESLMNDHMVSYSCSV